jgi:glycosyltransferase involved in cell wall biosynthesis
MFENTKEISVFVITYNSTWSNIVFTLDSILAQKEISYEIIISDDGSKQNHFNEIKEYFSNYNFKDYILVRNKNNMGTVENVICAVSNCTSKYQKGLGAGDALYGDHALRHWLDFTVANRLEVSFCDSVFYKAQALRKTKIELIKVHAAPQNVNNYKFGGEKLRKGYLLCGDICLGAAMLGTTKTLLSYLNAIRGKVKYAEDNVYRLMAYDSIPMGWFDECSILYEYGSGVSTQTNNIWKMRIMDDWKSANQILKGKLKFNNKFDNKLYNLIVLQNEIPSGFSIRKARYYFSMPCIIISRIKGKIHPRYTPQVYKADFINILLKGQTICM